MNNKTGRLLKRTAYGFYTLGVFFLIVGMLMSSVTSPALAKDKTPEVTEEVTQETTNEVWDKSSLLFSGGCQGNCDEVRATVCNGANSKPMAGTTTYIVKYNASGGEAKNGIQVASGEIPALGTGQCVDLTYKPVNGPGAYGFHFDQRPGHPGTNDPDAHWSSSCTISSCPIPETPTQETPTEVTPTEVTPTEVTPTQETPTPVTPTPETPTPVTPTPVTPTPETPTPVTPTPETPTPETPDPETPTPEPEIAELTVIKIVVNDDGSNKVAGDFTMIVTNNDDAPITFDGVSGDGHTISLNAGTYNVTEEDVDGYTSSFGNTCSGSIALGEKKTCTIVNDDTPPSFPPGNANLIVIKEVVGGTKVVADFPLFVNDKKVDSGITNQFLAGSYVVSEIGDLDYEAKFSGQCDANGVVTLEQGVTKTCTITNTYKAPVVTVTPHVQDPTPQATTPVPQNTLPAPQGTPAQGQPLIPVTGADLSHPGFPMGALPRMALNLGIALLGLAMVFHGASSQFKDEE